MVYRRVPKLFTCLHVTSLLALGCITLWTFGFFNHVEKTSPNEVYPSGIEHWNNVTAEIHSNSSTALLHSHECSTCEQPLLREDTPPPGLRFIPSTYSQYLTSVYTLWNLFDQTAMMLDGYRFQYGYIRKEQLLRYSQLVWKSTQPLVYCEVGMNAGHGTVAMLLANPKLTVYSFDIMKFNYSKPIHTMISHYFQERYTMFAGDSMRTIPKFAAGVVAGKYPKCDIVLVDGDHTEAGAYSDISNFASVTKCNSTLFLDDIQTGPGFAARESVRKGLVLIDEWNMHGAHSPFNPCLRVAAWSKKYKHHGDKMCQEWGWAVARYVSEC